LAHAVGDQAHAQTSLQHPAAVHQWIHDELRRSNTKLQVSFDAYKVVKGGAEGRINADVELRNVVAILPGRTARQIYLTAHYDSLNRGARSDADAPGANDNGSGTVLLMEVARVLAESDISFDATIVFMATAAEEQGLVGARLHVARAKESGASIESVLNNDIVGGIRDDAGVVDSGTVRVYSAGPQHSRSRQLARFSREIAARYLPAHRLQLLARRERVARDGDQTAFSVENIAAIRFTEARENFSKQHTGADAIDGVSFPYLAQNTRMNAAVLAALALAPPAPTLAGVSVNLQSDVATLRWHSAEGAIRYRLYWREAWGPEWQHVIDLGDVTEYVARRTLVDESCFGVSAMGPGGEESPISAFVCD
jgi:Zn-dependent M28 family amino/carboxypeptidase